MRKEKFSSETLREMRILAGVTLTELGTWTGVNASRICLFERGQHELREEQKAALYNALFQAMRRRVAAVDRILTQIDEPVLADAGGG